MICLPSIICVVTADDSAGTCDADAVGCWFYWWPLLQMILHSPQSIIFSTEHRLEYVTAAAALQNVVVLPGNWLMETDQELSVKSFCHPPHNWITQLLSNAGFGWTMICLTVKILPLLYNSRYTTPDVVMCYPQQNIQTLAQSWVWHTRKITEQASP